MGEGGGGVGGGGEGSVEGGGEGGGASALLYVFGSGTALGALHAILGPDHVSALLTLSVNQPPIVAAWLGVRWGLGHSLGLCVVTGCFLALRVDSADVEDAFEGGMDWIVGACMICLGMYGYYGAWRLRRSTQRATAWRGIAATSPVMRGIAALQLVDEAFVDTERLPRRAGKLAVGSHDDGGDSPSGEDASEAEAPSLVNAPDEVDLETGDEHADLDQNLHSNLDRPTECERPHPGCRSRCPGWCCRWLPSYEALIALAIGVLHGMGGPGGILGVLPSLLMPGLASSLAYLFGFCASATLAMGLVACCAGCLSSRLSGASPSLPWAIAAGAATLAVAVGVFWLVGCATGSLAELLARLGME